MQKIHAQFNKESSFAIISHTCMPEVDTVPLLKQYEMKMLGGTPNLNWHFVTGNKDSLYKIARQSYLLDNDKNNSSNIKDQFIHTQFFALVDKQRRLRGVYDGLKREDLDKLSIDIKGLLKENVDPPMFNNSTFSNNPN